MKKIQHVYFDKSAIPHKESAHKRIEEILENCLPAWVEEVKIYFNEPTKLGVRLYLDVKYIEKYGVHSLSDIAENGGKVISLRFQHGILWIDTEWVCLS